MCHSCASRNPGCFVSAMVFLGSIEATGQYGIFHRSGFPLSRQSQTGVAAGREANWFIRLFVEL
jgi:hypothetical protein